MENKAFNELIANAHVVLKDALSKIPDARLRAEMNVLSNKAKKLSDDLKATPEKNMTDVNNLYNEFKAKYGA